MGPIFLNNCYQCHGPGGPGSQKTDFTIQPPSYPGFLDENIATLNRAVIKTKVNAVPLLLAKPSMQQTAHEGGLRLAKDTPEYAVLAELQSRLESGVEPCGDTPAVVPTEVVIADAPTTFRKAALQLAGRLPTTEELAGLAADPTSLDALLLSLTREEGFYDWQRTAFNDALLTDSFLQYGGRAIDTMNDKDFGAINDYKGEGSQRDNRGGVNKALAREPVELMLHTVRNDLSFDKVVTADYTVVNPELAKIYKNATIDGAFNGDPSDDDREWLIARVNTDAGVAVPHAGIMTTPIWLNRYPTSPTNRSRGRVRVLMKTFLATDILEVANRPVDATAGSTLQNPTRNQPDCTTCHDIIDPLAGAFRGFGASDYEHFSPTEAVSGWYEEMKLPGYGLDEMPPSEYPLATRWVGNRIASDPRFDVAAVRLAYVSLTGREVSAYPKSDSPTYAADYAAWEAQDTFIRESAKSFAADNRNYRNLVVRIVESPYYRAIGVAPGFPEARLGEVSKLGTARLSTPEVLRRKITAVAGIPWRQFYDWDKQKDWLNEDSLRVLYGGIDSDSVIKRVREPNSIMANIQLRMANEVALLAVPYDFSKPAASRLFFPEIEVDDIAVGSEAKVRATVVRLHQQILGETLAPNDPEIDASVKLFQDTLADGGLIAANGKKDRENYMPYPGGVDPTTGKDIKIGETNFRADNTYALRAWSAVVAYLLSDSKFLID